MSCIACLAINSIRNYKTSSSSYISWMLMFDYTRSHGWYNQWEHQKKRGFTKPSPTSRLYNSLSPGICGFDFNTLRPRQNGRHFTDDMFKYLNKNVWISIKISLNFVPKDPINNNSPLVQIMAWCRPGNKPLSEPMMVSLLTHICVTRPQWVKCVILRCVAVITFMSISSAIAFMWMVQDLTGD